MTPAALAPAPSPADDPQTAMIAAYYNSRATQPDQKTRKSLAQFYTASPAAALLSGLALPFDRLFDSPSASSSSPPPLPCISDYACGAGALLLEGVRRAHASTGHSLADIVSHVVAEDLDIGALVTCRRVLSSLAPPAVPHCLWANSLFAWEWTLGTVDLDVSDLEAVDYAMLQFTRLMIPWLPHAPHLNERKPGPEPLGTVDILDNGRRIVLHWAPGARGNPNERQGAGGGTEKEEEAGARA